MIKNGYIFPVAYSSINIVSAVVSGKVMSKNTLKD